MNKREMIGGAFRPLPPDLTNWENEKVLSLIKIRKDTEQINEEQFIEFLHHTSRLKMEREEEGGKPFKYAKIWLEASQEIFMERFCAFE